MSSDSNGEDDDYRRAQEDRFDNEAVEDEMNGDEGWGSDREEGLGPGDDEDERASHSRSSNRSRSPSNESEGRGNYKRHRPSGRGRERSADSDMSRSQTPEEEDRRPVPENQVVDSSMYENPMCNVNVSKHFRVDVQTRGSKFLQFDKEMDGMCHSFVCEGEGSSPPRAMFTIIRALYYILNAPATSDHVVCRGKGLIVTWKKKATKTSVTRGVKHVTIAPDELHDSYDPFPPERAVQLATGGAFEFDMGELGGCEQAASKKDNVGEKVPLGQIKVSGAPHAQRIGMCGVPTQ